MNRKKKNIVFLRKITMVLRIEVENDVVFARATTKTYKRFIYKTGLAV